MCSEENHGAEYRDMKTDANSSLSSLRFQIFPLKVVVGIHDKNSVTERVSKSVQMLLPVRINTWK
jgi:hypothetical protein